MRFVRHAVFAEYHLEALQRRLPVMDRLPVLRGLAHGQVHRLQRGIVVGEDAPVAGVLAHHHVQRLGHWDGTTLTPERIVEHVRQRLLAGVKPATAYMDLKWLRVVLKVGRGAWGHPVQLDALASGIHMARHLELVAESTRRERRPSSEELEQTHDVSGEFITGAPFYRRGERI